MTFGLAAATVVAVCAQDAPVTEGSTEVQEEVIEMEDNNAMMSEEAAVPDQAGQTDEDDTGITPITEAELPAEVVQGLQDSEFAQATVQKAYKLDEVAVDRLIDNEVEQMYIGDQSPDKIYQLQVQGDEEQNILYFDEQGELLGSKSI